MSCNFFNRHKWEPIHIVSEELFMGQSLKKYIEVGQICRKCNKIKSRYNYSDFGRTSVHYLFNDLTPEKCEIIYKTLVVNADGKLILPEIEKYPPRPSKYPIAPPVHQPPQKIKWGL